MSLITLEDINTWIRLFDFDAPMTLDLSDTGEFELYEWTDNDELVPYFNHDDSYFTNSDDSVIFNTDGTIDLEDYNRENPFYLFPTLQPTGSTDGKLIYFYPQSNVKRQFFVDDDLRNRRFYIKFLGDEVVPVNGFTPYRDEYGWYVPMSVVKSDSIGCDVSGSRSYVPSVGTVYAPPKVTVVADLFIGNTNRLVDKISCPVTPTILFNNKEVAEFSVPMTGYSDSYRFHVTTLSEYPYVGADVYVTLNTGFALFRGLDDLEAYDYLKMNNDLVFSGESVVSSSAVVVGDGHSLSGGKFIVDGDLTLEDVVLVNPVFVVNGSLTLKGCTIINNEETTDYNYINNGELSFNECIIRDNGYIINNGGLSIVSSTLTPMDKLVDLPFIHNTGGVTLTGNIINYEDSYTSNNLMLIRGEVDVDALIRNNELTYNCELLIDEELYTVLGNGVVYGKIDDDTLYFKELEVD